MHTLRPKTKVKKPNPIKTLRKQDSVYQYLEVEEWVLRQHIKETRNKTKRMQLLKKANQLKMVRGKIANNRISREEYDKWNAEYAKRAGRISKR